MKAVAMEDVTPLYCPYSMNIVLHLVLLSLKVPLSPTVTKMKFLFTIYLYLFKHSSDEKKGRDHQG